MGVEPSQAGTLIQQQNPGTNRDQNRHLYFYRSIEDVKGISIFAYKKLFRCQYISSSHL